MKLLSVKTNMERKRATIYPPVQFERHKAVLVDRLCLFLGKSARRSPSHWRAYNEARSYCHLMYLLCKRLKDFNIILTCKMKEEIS